MGHLFVLHGDLRLLRCDAWLLPCDGRARPDEHWLSGPATPPSGFRWPEPPRPWSPDGLRTFPVEEWPADRPRPFLTNVGDRDGRDVCWYVRGAEAFVRTAAAAHRRARPTTRPTRARPLLALPIVGTGAGGARDVAGEVLRVLVPSLIELARELDVDLALVTRDAADFAAAQRERGRHERWHEIEPSLRQRLDALARMARVGELVLFVGAGVSAGAGLPGWDDLLAQLAEEAGITGAARDALAKLPAPDRARVLEARLSGRSIGEAAARLMRTDHHALAHALLASLPVDEVVTTNYDTLFEQASRGAGRELAVLPYRPARNATRWLLKLHGSVERPGEIVLKREDFLRYAGERAALAGIVQALLITRHMLFVGFSLQDDNFYRIADSVRQALVGGALSDEEARRTPEGGRTSRVHLGTALHLAPQPFVEELWKGELDWVAVAAEGAPIGEAARQLEVALDYLAAQSTSASAHLLDERFDAVLSDGERALRDGLRRLCDELPAAAREAPAYHEVLRLVRRLGGRSPQGATPTSRAGEGPQRREGE